VEEACFLRIRSTVGRKVRKVAENFRMIESGLVPVIVARDEDKKARGTLEDFATLIGVLSNHHREKAYIHRLYK